MVHLEGSSQKETDKKASFQKKSKKGVDNKKKDVIY